MNVIKRVMIIGGGVAAIPKLQLAEKDGADTYLVDMDDNCPAASYARHICNIEPSNRAAIMALKEQLRIDEVLYADD